MTALVLVFEEPCSTCIFRPGNPMHLNRGRVAEMVAECRERNTHITCHQTILGQAEREVICRGFYDAHGNVAQMVRIAERLGSIEFVPLP